MCPNDYWVLFNYGQMLRDEGKEEWRDHWQKTLSIFMGQLQGGELKPENAKRALTVANALGDIETVQKILRYQGTMSSEDLFFDESNTIRHAPDLTPVVL